MKRDGEQISISSQDAIYSHLFVDATAIVSTEVLERIYDMMQLGAEGGATQDLDEEDVNPDHYLHVINAFDMPWWNFNSERKAFEK